MNYFSPYSYSKNKIQIELYLSKNATGVNISQLAKKDDLANLKSEVYKLDIDKLAELDANKLKPVPVDLKEISVNQDNAKIKDIEDKIPDITNLATTAVLNAKINKVKNKILSTTNLANNASLNAKIKRNVKNEIPGITNLATSTAPNADENKIPNIGDLVKKNIL